MVFFNYALRKLNAKIVYYGPGLCGKTTNLVWVHDHFEGGDRGKMISLATEGDRTIFFDLLPLDIGSIRGMDVTLQLYTVPGQVHYNSTRQLVLRGADGVVFVADSQRAMQGSNVDSFKNLQENLLLQGISLDGFPHVLQFNKRDLKDLVSVEELNDELNHYSVPIFEATAIEGLGVQETLESIVKLVMRNLRKRYEGATTGARTPGVEDSQVRVPEEPPTPPPGPVEVPSPGAPVEPVAVAEAFQAPEEPVAPPEPPPPVEPIVPPEPPEVVEPMVPPEPTFEEPAAVTAPPDEPTPTSFVAPPTPDDPAKTIDFSRAGGSDPFGGLGGGFEDEVSTAVYDVNDDSAIDFDELKRLDEQQSPPMPPPEPPRDVLGAAAAPPEAPEAATPAFDLESTDAGAKTQDATEQPEPVSIAHDSMAAFDFNAPAPDMDSIPDFELDEPAPEPKTAPAPPEIQVEAAPSVVDVEPPAAAEPPLAAEPPAVEEVPVAAVPEAPLVEGRYEDRIEAPSPFAPSLEAPGAAPGILEQASAPVEAVPEEFAGEPAVSVDAELFEEVEVAPAPIGQEDFEATPREPVVVGNEDPWTEEELSGVYDLAEVEKAEREAAAIEVSEPRPVEVRAEDNQLHLRLQGTGAIVESGQVRALDIEVPVPGSWVGNRRVTLQLRLTLTPDTEDEDDGSGRPS